MGYQEEKHISQTTLFIFPIMVVMIAGIVAPISVALIGSLVFGNIIKVYGVADNLSKCAQGELVWVWELAALPRNLWKRFGGRKAYGGSVRNGVSYGRSVLC